ncbi:MAG: hypothetical protein IT382_01880 [Deltaproteobacteria bacterium]|nr:hypothetical protein [Deltaproteobacteria bacterium]
MESSLPAPLAAFVAQLDVRSLGMSAAVVGGGAIAAQLGGAALRQIDAVEDFAAGGPAREALTDAVGGLVIDAAVTAVVYTTSTPEVAARVGALMAVGTIVSAAAKPLAGTIAGIVDKGTSMVAGVLGKTPGGLADFDPSRSLTAAAPGGLADFEPGGFLAAPGGLDPYAVPGGDPYAG